MASKTKTQKLVKAALLTALLAILAPLTIPIGPIPFSLAFFGVALVGALQTPLWAMGSIGTYLVLGLAGLPIFSSFGAGPGVLMGPTGGYLAGYFLLALAISLARSRRVPGIWLGASASAGVAACYLLGTFWFMVVTGNSFASGLALCVLPFIIPDAIKISLALLLAHLVEKRMGKGRAAH